MTTLRAQAAAAAVRECPLFLASCDRSCSEEQIAICERNDAASYLLGHAAGVEEGARRFAEWLALDAGLPGHCYDPEIEQWKIEYAEDLSSLAPGTGLGTGEGQKEEG